MSILHNYYYNVCIQFISSIEEDPVTQQVQVEKLSEKQTEIADKKQQLQDRCDELETQVNELIAKVCVATIDN